MRDKNEKMGMLTNWWKIPSSEKVSPFRTMLKLPSGLMFRLVRCETSVNKPVSLPFSNPRWLMFETLVPTFALVLQSTHETPHFSSISCNYYCLRIAKTETALLGKSRESRWNRYHLSEHSQFFISQPRGKDHSRNGCKR